MHAKAYCKLWISAVSLLLSISLLCGCQSDPAQKTDETAATAVTTAPAPQITRPTEQETMALDMVNTIFDPNQKRADRERLPTST